MPIELAPGVVVADRYRLDRLLGEGGMGTVWAARDVASGAELALKLVKDSTVTPGARQRFLREARAVVAVRHPNVVAVHEILELADGEPVMVMDLLVGEPLSDRLRRDAQLSIEEVARIVVPVISAVGTAHALGIIHRDLKPENIFLAKGADGALSVKVLDFGIAKLTAVEGEAAQSTGLTATGAVLGTPVYMAPEQVFGESDLDHRVDVWALGLILYQCLSGVLPTAADNVGQILKVILTRPIWPLIEVAPDTPPEVAAIVDRMLVRGREQRLADLHEVRDALLPYAAVDVPDFGPSTVPLAAEAPADSGEDRRVVAVMSTVDVSAETANMTHTPVIRSDKIERPAPPPPRSRSPIVVIGSALVALLSLVVWAAMRASPASIATSHSGAPADSAPPSASPVATAPDSRGTSVEAQPSTPSASASSEPHKPQLSPALRAPLPPIGAKASATPSASAPPTLKVQQWE